MKININIIIVLIAVIVFLGLFLFCELTLIESGALAILAAVLSLFGMAAYYSIKITDPPEKY